MTTDLVTTNGNELTAQMDYARAVSVAALLPAAYRGKPADVLIAMGLGQAIGIPPAQALYEIYVVNGRPSPSANLMAALVRRAGHKLRINGDSTFCTATLIRNDDPDEPFTATWTIEQARAIGLTSKDTWKQYPAAMLRARATAEVVRMGASEAVLGMDYAKEEMEDVEDKAPIVKATGMAAIRAAVAPQNDAGAAAPAEDEPAPASPETITDSQLKALHASFNDVGIVSKDRDRRLAYCRNLIGRDIETSKDLTKAEASRVLDALHEDIEGQPAFTGDRDE